MRVLLKIVSPTYPLGMELRAGDILLRAPRASDLPDIVAACNDAELARFIPIPAPYREEDGRTWLELVERRWRGSDPEHSFAIVDGESGAFLGVITVRLWEAGTLGYWLGAEARGRGVMTDAVRAVVDWARSEHGIERLSIATHPDNIASQRVAEKAGFVRAGVTAQQPPFRDGTATAVRFDLAS